MPIMPKWLVPPQASKYLRHRSKRKKSGQVVQGKGLNFEIDVKVSTCIHKRTHGITSQLETLFRTNVDIAEALQILGEQTDNEMLSTRKIRDEVRQGNPFFRNETHPNFNELYISLVEVGQESGNLDPSCTTTRLHSKGSSHQAKVNIGSCINRYHEPIFTVVLALFICVIPRIKTFDSFGVPYLSYKIFSSASAISLSIVGISIFAFIAAVYAFRQWVQSESGSYQFDRIKLYSSGWSHVSHGFHLSVARTLSTLMKSGVPMTSALKQQKVSEIKFLSLNPLKRRDERKKSCRPTQSKW